MTTPPGMPQQPSQPAPAPTGFPPAGPPQAAPPPAVPPAPSYGGYPGPVQGAAAPQPPGGYPGAQQYPGAPGYPAGEYPAGYAPAPGRTPAQRTVLVIAGLAAVAVLGIVLGLTIPEDDRKLWSTVNAWGGLAIAAAVLTAAPAFASSVSLTPYRAFQVAAGGAAALVAFWTLLILPAVGSNTSLLVTVGVAAGVAAPFAAPGRPRQGQPGSSS